MILRTLSIRSRLTVWYAGSILLLFAGAGLALRGAVRRTLLSEFDSDALDSSKLVRQFFHFEVSEYPTVDEVVTDLASEIVFPDRAIQFVAPNGAVVIAGAKPADDASARRAHAPTYVRPPVHTLMVPLDSVRAPGWSIRIQSSAADLERTLSKLDYWFLVGAPFVAVLSGFVGWVLAGRLLHPVDAMARAAEQIGTAHVGRLPVENPDDELGRLGASFNGLLERLDDALSQQRRFLADAAHELRTPIARMSTLAELALAHRGENVAPSLARISTDLGHASRLLDELLQLARADAGERMQRKERVFLDDVAMDALAAWNPVAMRTGVTLLMETVEESPVRIDPLLARRLIDTLLENAVRYTRSGGRIEVTVRRSGDRIVLVVSDTGIGIPTDELPRIFERFFRGTRSRAMAPEGSGLGLPIAAWIVDQCGGSIDVASGLAGGTSVRVSVPIDAVSPELPESRIRPVTEISSQGNHDTTT